MYYILRVIEELGSPSKIIYEINQIAFPEFNFSHLAKDKKENLTTKTLVSL